MYTQLFFFRECIHNFYFIFYIYIKTIRSSSLINCRIVLSFLFLINIFFFSRSPFFSHYKRIMIIKFEKGIRKTNLIEMQAIHHKLLFMGFRSPQIRGSKRKRKTQWSENWLRHHLVSKWIQMMISCKKNEKTRMHQTVLQSYTWGKPSGFLHTTQNTLLAFNPVTQ